MTRYSVQRYTTKNDQNGNPRRVFVIRDEAGTIVATADEGYNGRAAAGKALRQLHITDPFPGDVPGMIGWAMHPDVTDLGDVDVSPGVYRRMKGYRVPKP
jgi:hypothetical protein